MGLTPPVSTEWIAHSGASFHTTPDAGILSSVRPPHPSCPSIMVGDGSCLPITAVGSAPGSFRLPMFLFLLGWFITFFLFVSLQLTTLVPSSLTLLASLQRIRPPGVRYSGVTARGPFTPFAFLLPLHHSRLLLRPGRLGLPFLPRRRLPPPSTAVLVTLAAKFWLSSVVVPMFLVLGLLLSPSAMRASSVVMFGSLFLLLLRMRRMPLI